MKVFGGWALQPRRHRSGSTRSKAWQKVSRSMDDLAVLREAVDSGDGRAAARLIHMSRPHVRRKNNRRPWLFAVYKRKIITLIATTPKIDSSAATITASERGRTWYSGPSARIFCRYSSVASPKEARPMVTNRIPN